MYKYLVLIIALFIIFIFALNIGVLTPFSPSSPSSSLKPFEGLQDTNRQIIKIGGKAGDRIYKIYFLYSDYSSANYGSDGGNVVASTTLSSTEELRKIKVYQAVSRTRTTPYRGGGYTFVIYDTSTRTTREYHIIPGNADPYRTMLSYTLPFNGNIDYSKSQKIGQDGPMADRPILDILWTTNYTDLNYMTNNKAQNPASSNAIHALPYDVVLGPVQPTIKDNQEKLLTELQKDTGVNMNKVNTADYSNITAITSFFRDVFGINFDRLTMYSDIDKSSRKYQDGVDLLKSAKEYGFNDIDSILNSLSQIRQLKSGSTLSGFTTIEGLNNSGELTDQEATCYINNDIEVLKRVGGNENRTIIPRIPGLKFRVFNSYYGLTNEVGKVFQWPLEKQGKEYDEYQKLLRNLNISNDECKKSMTTEEKVGDFPNPDRTKYTPCILAEGITLDMESIENATNGYIKNNNKSEQYTVEWKGYFTPDVTGNWFFGIASDDGAQMYIYDKNGVPNKNNRITGDPGLHGFAGSWGNPLRLENNKVYSVLILFGEAGGGDKLLFVYFCDNPQSSFYGNKNHYNQQFKSLITLFFVNSDANAVAEQKIQGSYKPETIQSAKLDWIHQGKPNTYNCNVNKPYTRTDADIVTASNLIPYYSTTRQGFSTISKEGLQDQYGNITFSNTLLNDAGNRIIVNPSEATEFARKKIETDKKNEIFTDTSMPLPHTQPFSTMEGFKEGIDIDELKFKDYLSVFKEFGITNKNDIPSVLDNIQNTYGVSVDNAQNINNFIAPLKDFNINTMEELNMFSLLFKREYGGFMNVTDYNSFFIFMSNLGIKYNRDRTSTFHKFMSKIYDFDINRFTMLSNFNNKCETMGYTNITEAIDAFSVFKANNYVSVVVSHNSGPSLLAVMTNYLGQENLKLTPEYIRHLTAFGVNIDNFQKFLNDSSSVSAKTLIEYIKEHMRFGVKFMEGGSSNKYTKFKKDLKEFVLDSDLNKYLNYSMLTIPADMDMKNEAIQEIFKIKQYIAMGISNRSTLDDITITKPKNMGSTKLAIHTFITDGDLLQFYKMDKKDESIYKYYSNRIGKTMDQIKYLGYTNVCGYIDFLKKCFTVFKIDYTTIVRYMSSNKSILGANWGNYMDCAKTNSTNRMGFSTISEGFSEGATGESNLFGRLSEFGSNYPKTIVVASKWKQIPEFNSILARFGVNNVEKYNIFLGELKKFGITPSTFVPYTNKLLAFGVKYDNIVEFTSYVSTIGVKYSGFNDFINIVMSMGVYRKDFIPFLCYLYSFGVSYSPESGSKFFKFLSSMKSYGLTYTPATTGGYKFMNAINNFVYLLSYGEKNISCENPMENIKSLEKPPYFKYYFPFKPNTLDPIEVPLTKIMDICRTLDNGLNDFANENQYIKLKRIGFNSDAARLSGGGFTLNLPTNGNQVPYKNVLESSYRLFMNRFINSNQNKENILDVPSVTTFMEQKEYDILRKGLIQVDTFYKVLERMEQYNISQFGKVDLMTVYNGRNISINTMKLFPYYSINNIINYIATSPNMKIPCKQPDGSAERPELNPNCTRCKPYINVGYDTQACSDTFTTLGSEYSSEKTIGPMWNSITQLLPVQPIHKNLDFLQPPKTTLTIQNPSMYASYGNGDTFSNVNW